MRRISDFCRILIIAMVSVTTGMAGATPPQGQAQSGTASAPAQFPIPNTRMSIRVSVQSPTDTDTGLQVVCLFKSAPGDTFRGALSEIDTKLNGLLVNIRQPSLFRGDLGETLLITPKAGAIRAKNLLIVGVGDLGTFTPERMQEVGAIVFREANRLGVAHPFFSPTLVDGGMTKYTPGEVAEQVSLGFLRALATEKKLADAGDSPGTPVQDLTYLTVGKFVSAIGEGIQKAIAANGVK